MHARMYGGGFFNHLKRGSILEFSRTLADASAESLFGSFAGKELNDCEEDCR